MNRKLLYLGILAAVVWILLFALVFAQPGAVPQPQGEKGKMVFVLVNLLLGSSAVPFLTNLAKKVPILAGPGAVVSSGVLGVLAAFIMNWLFDAGLGPDYLLLLGLGGNQTAASFMFEIYKTFLKKG